MPQKAIATSVKIITVNREQDAPTTIVLKILYNDAAYYVVIIYAVSKLGWMRH